jgi:ATP-dependent Lon protease
MPKRLSRESAKDRKGSADLTDGDSIKPPPKKKPNHSKSPVDKGTMWINDDTLSDSDSDSDYVPSEEDSDEDYDGDQIPIFVNIHLHTGKELESDSESEEEFMTFKKNKYVPQQEYTPDPTSKKTKNEPSQKPKKEKIPIQLSRAETKYYNSLPAEKRKSMLEKMNNIAKLLDNDGDIPYKFKILDLPIPEYMKSIVIKKATVLEEMPLDGGESYKLRNWMDGFLRIPFGKTIPLPVKFSDGSKKCTDFMVNARKSMDSSVYGMTSAKTQIMQTIAQWIVNPDAAGNVIALQGPMGVGKTSFARNAIASVLKRPFEFFSLGGASDIANFVGHSYTYEGSMWGRISDSLMHAGSMNPVMYFDELDKVSTTPHGEEIVSMMIHLTDRSQNTQFHDRYFSGIDLDVSQCLFVFSFNDIEKVHPILRDRMTVIHCPGYSKSEKTIILKDYVLPQLLDKLRFKSSDIILTDTAISSLIDKYSDKESGVRSLIRVIEVIMTRLNMLRISQDESMKDYVFYMNVSFPFKIDEKVVDTLLKDYLPKETESWRTMYI